ncbi:uncharacterized protein M421DRAFT_374071 [Didymella exigua CBS 183.55]|uniref:Uncharacterized protein n=1 Tax=Didymella exigua CBS 183.55 TaxID=1150837 RepID=A0A6A5RSU0_9PLEO|nr:uncharacterized protein M421DRAFT_374071 [Didymella exigua CBS 183.55]KAF1930420.1 hypothetical protein M421DRAFT_374071 [Didymella exigua CBS 183.55]
MFTNLLLPSALAWASSLLISCACVGRSRSRGGGGGEGLDLILVVFFYYALLPRTTHHRAVPRSKCRPRCGVRGYSRTRRSTLRLCSPGRNAGHLRGPSSRPCSPRPSPASPRAGRRPCSSTTAHVSAASRRTCSLSLLACISALRAEDPARYHQAPTNNMVVPATAAGRFFGTASLHLQQRSCCSATYAITTDSSCPTHRPEMARFTIQTTVSWPAIRQW